MQPASEKCSYLEEHSCKEDSLKGNWICSNQTQDTCVLLAEALVYNLFGKKGT